MSIKRFCDWRGCENPVDIDNVKDLVSFSDPDLDFCPVHGKAIIKLLRKGAIE